jgi:predicted metal-dependent peptidase
MDHLTAAEKITKARAGLVLDEPFWGSLVLRLVPVEDETCEVGWTDGIHLGYNPKAIDSMPLSQVKTFLAHESGGHVAMSHHVRRGSRDKKEWNVATDHVVNNILSEAGFQPIPGWLCEMRFQGMSAEAVYAIIHEEKAAESKSNGGGNSGRESDDTGNDPGGCGEVRDLPGADGSTATESQKQQAEADAKVAVMQAEATAKKYGRLPAGIAREIEKIMQSKVPWQEVMRRFVDQQCRNDYTWSKPNSRYLAGGIYLPELSTQEMRPIVVGADTSGSTGREAMNMTAAELTAIIEQLKVQVTVMYADCKVQLVEEFDADCLPVVLHPKGGGGTDYRPVFAEIEQRALQPAAVIYVTDGKCDLFPEKAPEYPVLWAVLGENRRFRPPWGEVIEVI